MDVHCQRILDEFKEQREIYEYMKENILRILREKFAETGMYLAGIEGRVKTEKSLEGKLELKGTKYRSLLDITDILGARIITFYTDEIDTVAAIVETMFEIDWENSVDKRKVLENDRFGYMSLHYICRLPKSLYYDEKHPEINEIRFELQMRTALQHVWATIEHDMGYKKDVEIPKEYGRRISRLAGLLEIADEEFKSFRNGINEYRRKVKALVKDGKFEDIMLSTESFMDYLKLNPFDELNKKIATTLNAEIQTVSLMPYLMVFEVLQFRTLADIENLKNKYEDGAYKLALYQLQGKEIDIVSSSVGIHNLLIVCILSLGGGEFGIKCMLDALYGEKDRNRSTAKRIVEQAKLLNLVQ